MFNLTLGATNNVVVYADTVSSSVGNFFTIVFTNAYSRETFEVVPSIVRRNYRFVELEFDTVGVTGYSDPINGLVYLYPIENFDYIVYNTATATLTPLAGTHEEIDRGQAFLYTEDECDREIKFVPYISDNEGLFNVVYVTSIPMANFPCTVFNGEYFTVETNTITYCNPVLIENGGTVQINDNIFLKQQPSPYEPC
jgi:hypothetical protein